MESKEIKFYTKKGLYDAVVKTSLLYGSETWPMMAANMKKLEAVHHKQLRRILKIKLLLLLLLLQATYLRAAI